MTNHALAGAAIGARTGSPVRAFLLGLASHVVMDAVPHWGVAGEAEFLRAARVDGVLGLLVCGACVTVAVRRRGRAAALRVAAGITGAVLPDLNKPWTHFTGAARLFPEPIERFHGAVQHEDPARMPVEVLGGAGLAVAALWALTRRPVLRG